MHNNIFCHFGSATPSGVNQNKSQIPERHHVATACNTALVKRYNHSYSPGTHCHKCILNTDLRLTIVKDVDFLDVIFGIYTL